MNFKKYTLLLLYTSLAVIFHGCDVFNTTDNNSGPAFSNEEVNSGGATTVHQRDKNAFSRPAANLSDKALEKHAAGDVNFEDSFVTAPAAIDGGLGPLYNNTSCISCHVNDGRGKPFFDDGRISSVLVRLSHNGNEPGLPIPVEGFGLQLQNKSVFNKVSEAEVEVIYEYVQKELADGTTIKLRKPTYQLLDPYTPLPANVQTSVRTAPPVFGKPNYVTNDKTGQRQLGRFGWKANQPTVLQQVAVAYNQDMGITSPYYKKENIYQNTEAQDGLDDDPEISQQTLDQTTFYVETLGVPAKRNVNDPMVKRGKKLFNRAGCQSCHTPRYTTGTNADIPAVSNQVIFPYTDLLLHDMGKELADHRSDFEASGREWRTAPLWGIGLVESINGHQSFLHDGRAQSILEAILWHGGEGQKSREFVKQLSKTDRRALVAFVKSI